MTRIVIQWQDQFGRWQRFQEMQALWGEAEED